MCCCDAKNASPIHLETQRENKDERKRDCLWNRIRDHPPRRRHHTDRPLPQRIPSPLVANRLEARNAMVVSDQRTQAEKDAIRKPILKGVQGVREIENAIDQINARGGRVNSSCGLHITVSWNGDAAALARLISLVGNHEERSTLRPAPVNANR